MAYGLLAHCFGSSGDDAPEMCLARSLTDRGIALLHFNFAGLQGHGGAGASVDDLELAAAFLRENYKAPQLLVGHSLGGVAALAVSERLSEVQALVTINTPSDLRHVVRPADAIAELNQNHREPEALLGERRVRLAQEFVVAAAERRLLDSSARLGRPLLMFHSPADPVVGIDQAERLYQAARQPKSFVCLDGADHMVSQSADAEFMAAMLSQWARRYLPEPPAAAEEAAAGTVEVIETGEGRFTQEVGIGRHRVAADEPIAQGGLDRGPSPYDLLLASLGACTAMTLRLYAERRQLSLRQVRVRLHHAKIHAEDCADCETRNGLVDRIDRVITLQGQLTEQERIKLLEIANKCPVHRTLQSEISVNTRLAE